MANLIVFEGRTCSARPSARFQPNAAQGQKLGVEWGVGGSYIVPRVCFWHLASSLLTPKDQGQHSDILHHGFDVLRGIFFLLMFVLR